MTDYNNPWVYNKEPVADDTVVGYTAFVYEIENLTNGKKYIGKKRLQFLKTKTVNKKKKKVKVPSDWKTYYGSNKALQEDVEKLGESNFRRVVLRLCKTLSESNYYEAREQFVNDVLLSDDYYNSWISVRITSKHMSKRG